MSKSVSTSTQPSGYGPRDGSGQGTDTHRRWAWAAIAACAVTLTIAFIGALFPRLPSGQDYMRGSAPWWITALAATLGVVAALAMRMRVIHANLRRVVVVTAWIICALLLWSAAGVVFDVLRAAAVLGIPGLPPFVDWFGMARRAAALIAAVVLAATILSLQARDRVGGQGVSRYGGWWGYAAAMLCIPYPALKIYWSLGGTVGWNGGPVREPAIGETVMLLVLVALSLALVQRWGRIIPRPLLLIGGYGAAAPLILMGTLVAFGTLAQLLGIVNGPIRFSWSEWIVYFTYGDWLLLGLTLGAATRAYQQRTREARGRD